MKIKIFLFILPVTVSLFSILFISRVNAEEFTTSEASFSIKIEKEATNFTIQNKITNDKENKLIGGYNIIVPRTEIKSLKATLNDVDIASSSKVVDEFFSEIVLDFQGNVIKKGETKTLKITYSSTDFVQSKEGDFKFAYLKSTLDKYSNFSIKISKDLGEPSYVSNQIQFEEKDGILSHSDTKMDTLFIRWGNEYSDTYNTSFTLSNETDQEVNSLISLPTSYNLQKIDFSKIDYAKYGLYDKYNNQFAVINVPSKSSTEIDYSFRLNKYAGIDYSSDMVLKEDGISKLGLNKEVDEILGSEEDAASKFSKFGDLLGSKYDIVSEQSNYQTEQKFLEAVLSKDKINSLGLAYLNCYFAKQMDSEQGCQIEFGYLNLYSQKDSKLTPSFWNVIQMNNETFLVDTFGSNIYGIEMYGFDNDLDRIKFGTWEEGLTYIDALGHFHSDGQFQTLSHSTEEITTDIEEITMMVQPKSANVYSGFYHSFNFSIENFTSRFVTVRNLKYGSTSQEKSITLNENLKIALLPNQENQFQLSKFRNINFFDSGLKEVDFTLELNDEDINEVKSSVRISYKVYDEAVIAFLILFNFVLFTVAFAAWKFYFRKKYE